MSFNKPVLEATPQKLDLKNWDEFLVGTFKKDDNAIEDSMSNTMARFERLTPNIKKSSKLLMLSGGHTFLPVYVATKYKCKITVMCRDEASVQLMNKTAKQYEVEDTLVAEKRDFNLTQFDYDQFDMAWSVNSIYGEDELMPVLREIRRILQPQGRLVMCELTSDDLAVQEEMGILSTKNMERIANKADLEKVYLKDFIKESGQHYEHLTTALKGKKAELAKIDKLASLVADDKLVWTFMQFQKRNA